MEIYFFVMHMFVSIGILITIWEYVSYKFSAIFLALIWPFVLGIIIGSEILKKVML